MNIDIGAKRGRKRLKRLRIIAGRLTAFGQKCYPNEVLVQMKRAERFRNRQAVAAAPAITPGWQQSKIKEKRSGFFKRLFSRKTGGE
jgi:hypothetical protein